MTIYGDALGHSCVPVSRGVIKHGRPCGTIAAGNALGNA